MNHAATVRSAATAAAAAPTDASQVKPFIDAMADLFACMNALVIATNGVDPTSGAAALAAFTVFKTRFETRGPVLTVKKNSTLAPTTMSDDDVLAAGDRTAATPATLLRHDPSDNTPANGARVQTKHQLVYNNVMWVAMKDDVTFNSGPPPTLTGGTVISAYPTSMTSIPPDPVHPAKDADRFSRIP